MNQLLAMEKTLELARQVGMDSASSDNSELDYEHLVDMYATASAGNFSEAKLGRWLGWMQAAVVANGFGPNLEDMKRINRSCK